MGRRIKSLKREVGYLHREHRSKKGRKKINSFREYKTNRDYKFKKEKIKNHENSIFNL